MCSPAPHLPQPRLHTPGHFSSHLTTCMRLRMTGQDSLVCNRRPSILYFDISFSTDDSRYHVHGDDIALHSLLTIRVAAHTRNDIHIRRHDWPPVPSRPCNRDRFSQPDNSTLKRQDLTLRFAPRLIMVMARSKPEILLPTLGHTHLSVLEQYAMPWSDDI